MHIPISPGNMEAAEVREETDSVQKEEISGVGESSIDISTDEIIVEDISYIPCNSMSWAFVPKPSLPLKADFEPVQKFVDNAISHRSIINRSQIDPSIQKSAGLGYKAILDLLRKRDDVKMLVKILLALRTSGGGTTLGKITRDSKRHSTLVHLIFRLDPFLSPEEGKSLTDSNATQNISSDWSLTDAYLNLIVALVSANSVFLTPALNMLWRFIQRTDAITPLDRQLVQFMEDDATEEQMERDIEYQFQRNLRLHGALSKILHLVPKGNSEIFPVIASSFPFKLSPLQEQACYVKQCFIILNYVPMIRRSILELCIDKCLEIDVEIRIAQDGNVKIEEVKDEDRPGNLDALFNMDKDVDKATTEKKIEAKEKVLKEKSSADLVDEFAEKLDTLMFLIFQYLVTLSELDSKDTTPRDLYKMVIFSFDSVILTTHRSKFVQFIILFLCGLDYQKHTNDTNVILGDQESTSEQFMLSREFAAKLIELVLDPFRPGINRQSAACYLASFVSRSTSVCAETACEAVSALLRFAEAYMDTYPTEVMARNANRGVGNPFGNHVVSKVEAHGLYYTVCQAAFYIICFRGKESIDHHQKAIKYHRNLESSNEDVDVLLYSDPRLIDISTKRWTRIVSHHLNPLKYCLESVRGEFLLLSDRFNLIESEVLQRLIIEDRKMASGAHASKSVMNKPSSIRTAATLERRRKSGGVGGLGRGSNPLDSFFPFDPYLLRRSYAYIDPHYRHWSGSPSADDMTVEEIDNDEIIHEDSSDDEEDEEEEGSVQFHENEDDDSVGDDCVAMSLTSTTCSIPPGEDTDDEVAADDMAIPKDTWVAELKRARALSVEDCW